MISKELLSEVLDLKYPIRIIHHFCKGQNVLNYDLHVECALFQESINIYELAHKCKEWAWEKHSLMLFQTQYFPKVYYGVKDLKTPMEDFISKVPQCDRFSADTEPEAIFKACEHILKEIK